MALSVDWPSKVINVPQSYLTFLGGTDYELNVNTFRLGLKDLEDDEDGMTFLDTHKHNTEVVLGGVTYVRVIEIINGYTVTFENGSYTVSLEGGNTNILDVTNLNSVSVRSKNSAGYIEVNTGAGPNFAKKVAAAVWDERTGPHTRKGSFGRLITTK